MSRVRKSRQRHSRSKPNSADEEVELNVHPEISDNDGQNDTIPFQRLESPMPCPPQQQSSADIAQNLNFKSLNTTKNSNDDDDDDDEDSELFPSLDYDTDQNDDGGQLRPPSQNSIASVLKHSFHEAKQMIHLCGVGEAPYGVQRDFLQQFHSESGPESAPDSMSRIQTASPHLHLEKQFGNTKENSSQGQQVKNLPFPLSIYPSYITSSNEPNPLLHQRLNTITNKTIPLRHSQSVPIKPEPIPHLFMRRSASTPTSFKIGKGRSAFGKVDCTNTFVRSSTPLYSSPQVSHVRKSVSTSCMSDGKCQGNTNNEKDTGKVSLFNAISLSTPAKQQWLSTDQSSNNSPPLNNDDVSSTSTSYSKSQIMNSKTQKMIKERRRNDRRKLKATNDVYSSSVSTLGQNKEELVNSSSDQNERSFDVNESKSNSKIDEDERVDVSYLSLEPEMNTTNEFAVVEDSLRINNDSPVDFPSIFSERSHTKTLRNVESPTPIPQPAYHKIVDDEQPSPIHLHSNPPLPVPHSRRVSRTPPSPIGRVATPPSNPSHKRLVLKGSTSPCSHDSASYSRTSRSGQSLNTSAQTHSTAVSCNYSCNRSVTSSVAEADREVRDTNRRELKRREGVDLDGSMSIQSSDTTSTNAYLALTSSPAQLRDGANVNYDRFFSNNSIGPANSQSSHASSNGLSWNQNQQYPSPGMNSRIRTSVNVRSPITVSSNSISNTNSSTSTGEDPPRFVSCSSKAPPIITNRGDIPPRSEHHDSSLGYSKLGSSKSRSKSRSSSRSSSSKSKSSKSKKKDQPRLYQKIGSAKVADQYMGIRTSTPSPCNSYQTSTPVTPPSHFEYELIDVPKPKVHRQFPVDNVVPGSKSVFVSPNDHVTRKNTVLRPTAQNFFQPKEQRVFRPARILEAVTPENEGNIGTNTD
jgi:hypothetical protein